MGDTPLQTGAPVEFSRQDAAAGAFQASPAVVPGHISPGFSPSHVQQQQHGGGSHHAFSSQLDTAQTQGPPRGGAPFDMGTMANALPPTGYRPGPYSQGQPRYSAIAMPSPASQFAAQGAMAPVHNQQYYLPQHSHLAHFYPTPLSPPQPRPNLPSGPDLGYYQNAVVVNRQPHPATQFYYPHAVHYPGQTPGQLLVGQYSVPSPQAADPRQHRPAMGGQVALPASPVDGGKSEYSAWPRGGPLPRRVSVADMDSSFERGPAECCPRASQKTATEW